MQDKKLTLKTLRAYAEKRSIEEKNILERYDSINVTGAMLIDGNHCYLEALNAFNLFNESYAKYGPPKIKNFIFPNIYHDFKGYDLAELILDQLQRLNRTLAERVARDFVDTGKVVSSRDTVINNLPDPECTVVLSSKIEPYAFDAQLPPAASVIRRLEKELKAATQWGKNTQADNLNNWLRLVESGKWKVYYDRGHIEVPYDLKSDFLNAVTIDENEWHINYGIKKTEVRYNGDIFQKEKCVDTLLVIKGCEIAERSEIDYVCIVTNDSDFAPLIEHLTKKGKKVYLYSICNQRKVSGSLKKAVGDRWITIRDVESDFRSGQFYEHMSRSSGILKEAANYPALFSILQKVLGAGFLESLYKDHDLFRNL